MNSPAQNTERIGPVVGVALACAIGIVVVVWYSNWKNQPTIDPETRRAAESELLAASMPSGAATLGAMRIVEKIGYLDMAQSFSAPIAESELVSQYDQVLRKNGWRVSSEIQGGSFTGRRYCKSASGNSLMTSVQVTAVSPSSVSYEVSVQAGIIARSVCG